jgi:hypothetical protein
MSKSPSVRMRLNGWSYADYLAFTEAMRSMNLRVAFELADKIIESWGYPEPFKAGALRKMNVEEAMRVLRTVLNTLNEFAENIDTDGVVVDFSKWSLDNFLKFNELREKGDGPKVMKMVREVAMLEDLHEDAEPTMTQGVLMVKAVNDAIGAILAGKN